MFTLSFCFILAGCILQIYCMGGNMIDDGVWEVLAVNECDNPDQYRFILQIEKHKVNRTHDAFSASMNMKQALDSSYGLKIKICKWVDGGCKDYQVITDENIVDFIKKVAEENLRAVLEMIGIEGGDFPIPEGEYEALDYLIDYCEFPCQSVLGKFDAEVLLLDKDNIPQACVLATVEFREPDDPELLCEKSKFDHLIDYCEFPCQSVLGKFDAEVLLLDKDNIPQACVLATVEFREPDDPELLCEKCKDE